MAHPSSDYYARLQAKLYGYDDYDANVSDLDDSDIEDVDTMAGAGSMTEAPEFDLETNVVPLNAFNNQVPIATAMSYSRAQVLNLFNAILANPNTYGVIASSQGSLALVVQKINTLVNGQAIILNPAIVISYQGNSITHETLFDLVGWIFSVSGTSPAGADRSNYYYPLLALYCMFIRRLCPNPRQQYDRNGEPQMVQITWFAQGAVTRVAVGANLDKPGRPQKDAARVRRATRMVTIGWLTAQERDTLTFVRTASSPAGQQGLPQLFGHCAESLPFMYIQSIAAQVNLATAAGLALQPPQLLPIDINTALNYDEQSFRNAARGPCANCQVLIRKLNMTLANFRRP